MRASAGWNPHHHNNYRDPLIKLLHEEQSEAGRRLRNRIPERPGDTIESDELCHDH